MCFGWCPCKGALVIWALLLKGVWRFVAAGAERGVRQGKPAHCVVVAGAGASGAACAAPGSNTGVRRLSCQCPVRLSRCGEYGASVRLLEKGVDDAGRDSQLGGEVLLWLALAYQVSVRHSHVRALCASEGRCSCSWRWPVGLAFWRRSQQRWMGTAKGGGGAAEACVGLLSMRPTQVRVW